MSNRPELAVGAVVIDEERLLLVRRGHGPAAGDWSIPGGRVEGGETLAEALVREVAEETDLEVVAGELIGWSELIDPGFHVVILDFWATQLTRADPVPGDDAAEARWVPLTEVSAYRLAPGLADFLHDHHILDAIPTVERPLLRRERG